MKVQQTSLADLPLKYNGRMLATKTIIIKGYSSKVYIRLENSVAENSRWWFVDWTRIDGK